MTGSLISFIAWKKGHKRYLTLSLLLLTTFILEVYVLYLIKKNVDFTYLYHIYTTIEYPLFCWFLLDAIRKPKIKRFFALTIPIYILTTLLVSSLYYHFTGFPGINIELEGMLQSIVCTYILFNLDIQEDVSILWNQYFWICSGILIFFGTSFFFTVYSRTYQIWT